MQGHWSASREPRIHDPTALSVWWGARLHYSVHCTCRRSLAGVSPLSLLRLGPVPAQLLIRWIPGTFVGAQLAAAHSHVVPKVKKDRINTSTSLNDIILRWYFILLYFTLPHYGVVCLAVRIYSRIYTIVNENFPLGRSISFLRKMDKLIERMKSVSLDDCPVGNLKKTDTLQGSHWSWQIPGRKFILTDVLHDRILML